MFFILVVIKSMRKPMSTEEYTYKCMSRICGYLLENKSTLRKDVKKTTENELIKAYRHTH